MTARPIKSDVRAGGEPDDDGPGVSVAEFREGLARWASGVAILAVRDPDDGRIYASTVSSFASVSARPPRIVTSLGPGAQPLPFLEASGIFVVSILADGQRGLAQRFTDAFPVGPSPFPAEGPPSIDGAHSVLDCRVDRVVPVGNARLIIGLVTGVRVDDSAGPLLHYRREYRSLD